MTAKGKAIKGMGARVKEARTERRMFLRHLAEKTALSVPYLSELENDHVGASATSLALLHKALGVSIDWLVLGQATPAQQTVNLKEHLIELMEAMDRENLRLKRQVQELTDRLAMATVGQ